MTIAENAAESKRNSMVVPNANDVVLLDPERGPEETSNSSTEDNPLLVTDRKNSSVKIDMSITKSKKTAKEEDNQATLRKDVDDRNAIVPPDGGLRAWMIMIGSFVINGVLFSVINTYSLIYLELQKSLLESGETAASSKAGEFSNFSLFDITLGILDSGGRFRLNSSNSAK